MKQPCPKCKTVGMFTEPCPKCRGKYGKDCVRCDNEGSILEMCPVCKGQGYIEDKDESDK
jgi:DnaJ-class molecular chaperone